MSKRIVLFDVDGTLTTPRNKTTSEMLECLSRLRNVVSVAIVGGSDLCKICEQLGSDIIEKVDFVFAENGLETFKNGKQFAVQSIKTYLGEETLKEFINWCLHYLADIDIPIKRGTFIEFRNGMLNVSPIGRNCSQEERNAFEIFDKEHKVREKMITAAQERFQKLNLTMSIGGQISFDVFPQGWDKTFSLRFLEDYEEIFFFGDKTMIGGNDYEIAHSPRVTKAYTVTGPEDTIAKLEEFFLKRDK